MLGHCLQVFLVGGSWSGGVASNALHKYGEVLSANGQTWRTLTGVDAVPMQTNDKDGPYRADNHMWLFGWSGGRGVQLACKPVSQSSMLPAAVIASHSY